MSKSVVVIGTRGYPSYYGGFETAVRRLAPFLADAGWDVNVYCRAGQTKDDDEARDPRIRTTRTVGLESKSLSTLSFGLSSVLHALWHKPQVALVMNVANGFFLPLLKLRGIPTVVNVDGIEWERAKWNRFAKFVFRLGARLTARYGTILISDSLEIQRRWKRDFGRKSVFIPYGANLASPSEVVPGLEPGSYVLMVARFVPENTVSEFFQAAERLAEQHPVVIVGSSGYGGPLDEAAQRLGEHPNVQWLGHVSDDKKLLSLWHHAGAYFHGHSVGGTNPALVQAMACGAPVVARQTPYNAEVLRADEHLVAPDPLAIESALRRMLTDHDLRAKARAANQARAATHYDWDDVCRRYELTLQEAVLGEKAAKIGSEVRQ
ncbi:glycosyltransferase [Pseudarthrobacter oxydans]|jgi:glycosyltransferase involved in cell wall biosynthesis|uniref:Glycosyltransferase involved in cell wall biosynthesis n=2 Tax=Pseudarthrobacter oxydans TaxID=1671 RepID=A0AAW8NFG5_PSEOX|nr:glycosyltransferase [Pseudarthrobacter oxydans]MDR6794873.1 glycosyltransferase involved in cell wall biosynthesis [Pseudarthrobacter oxydans]MDR7166261.1 glycosyltransferase involved in cell wall biosynthesis [Pseudarthrobacter oxydans]MDV2980441.1 glycosyltransferase [Actinomycetes bacterium ARC8]